MKAALIACSFILMLSNIAFSQNADKITHIKTIYQQINADKSLTEVVVDNDELSRSHPENETTDGGSELKGFFRGDTLVKITYEVGLSFGMKTFEYYLDEGKVVFVYEKVRMFVYNEKQGMDYTHLTTNFEGRYYIDKNKPFKIMETTKSSPVESNEACTNLASTIAVYSKILRKKKR